jgi:hypothetical protein
MACVHCGHLPTDHYESKGRCYANHGECDCQQYHANTQEPATPSANEDQGMSRMFRDIHTIKNVVVFWFVLSIVALAAGALYVASIR